MYSFERYFNELARRVGSSEPRAQAAWLCRIYAQVCVRRDQAADSAADDRRYRRLEGLVEVLYDYWPEFEALKVASAQGAFAVEDVPDPARGPAPPGLLVLRSRLNHSLCRTPKRCSSSIMTSPRSLNRISLESRRCVPITTSVAPS